MCSCQLGRTTSGTVGESEEDVRTATHPAYRRSYKGIAAGGARLCAVDYAGRCRISVRCVHEPVD